MATATLRHALDPPEDRAWISVALRENRSPPDKGMLSVIYLFLIGIVLPETHDSLPLLYLHSSARFLAWVWVRLPVPLGRGRRCHCM